jgi:predicted PurR-regulated permease PerM
MRWPVKIISSPPQENSRRQTFWILATVVTIGLLIYFLRPILVPFFLALILAYIFDPFVNRLQSLKIGRGLGAAIVMAVIFTLMIAMVLILIPMFQQEFALLGERLPDFFTRLNQQVAPWIRKYLGVRVKMDLPAIGQAITNYWKEAGDFSQLFASLKIGGMAIFDFFVNLILLPVLLFYLLRDWNVIVQKVDQLVPRPWHNKVSTIAREVDAILAEFLRGQVSVMILMSVFYVISLSLVGLNFALPVGIVTGLLIFIPYVGSTTGLIFATLAGLIQFETFTQLLPVWGVFLGGQLLVGYVVVPRLIGDRIGLHPVIVIFALLAFGALFGFLGVLLALPASAILVVGWQHLRQGYLSSDFYKN